jgi:hypothetical protein
VAVEVLGVRAEAAHVADEEAQHVDVVDAVLQQVPAPTRFLSARQVLA